MSGKFSLNNAPAGYKISYQDKNIAFLMDGEPVYTGNIVFEKFLRSIPMHEHSDNSFEIHYISGGHGHVTIDSAGYDVGKDTLYITGPHVPHSMTPDPTDPLCEYCVYLRLSDKAGKGNKSAVLSSFRKHPVWFGRDKENMLALMESLFSELDAKTIGYRTQAESLLRQLIVACVRNYSVKETEVMPERVRPIDHQFLVIEEAFLYEYKTLTLTALSSRLNLSTRQTERLLKDHYGKTFQSKKTEAKMSAAVLMLRAKNASITRISEELGYSSVEHFSSAFSRYYGVSPREYRKRRNA